MIKFSLSKAIRFMAKGENEKAEKCFLKAIGSNDITSLVNYGYFLTRKGESGKAVLLFEERIIPVFDKKKKQKSDEEILIYTNYGLSLSVNKDLTKAIEITEKLMEKYQTTLLFGNLGYFYILSGNIDKAKSVTLKGYDFSPEDVTIIDNLARIYFLEENYVEAEKYYNKLMEKKPSYPDAYNMYAEFLIKTGKEKEAIPVLEKCLSFNFTAFTLADRENTQKLYEKISKGE